jgi:peptide/nickel transport system substrate-binding protein
MRRAPPLLATCALILLACAPPQPKPGGTADFQPQPIAPATSSTLSMLARFEPTELAAKAQGSPSAVTKRLFNAALALIDGEGKPRPYLAETLPQLGSDTWRVLPGGRMETTYRLRPSLRWHDGQPLTAEDFVFAWRVYASPGLGVFTSQPQDQIDEVVALDPLTVRIKWSGVYPDGGALSNGKLDPLPKHILGPTFTGYEQDPSMHEAFLNQPYWTMEFVGLGPYRLDRWEAGSHIEAVAAASHALGRPKIDRIVVRYISDENTALTAMLGESALLASELALRFEQALVLKREWGSAEAGVVVLRPGTRHFAYVQLRPEYLKTPALLDVRVRRALAHSVDRQALDAGLFDGEGLMAETFVTRQSPYFAEVDRAIVKYPFDPRATEQMLHDVGFARGTGGFFATGGERFRPDFGVGAGAQFERQLAIMTDTWSRVGIDVQPYVMPAAQVRDNQPRAIIPGILTTSASVSEDALVMFTSAQIGSPATRWGGGNRGAWVSAEYDRLWTAYSTGLDRTERNREIVRMMRLVSEEIPGIPLYFNVGVTAHRRALTGPEIGTPETLEFWNIHEWVIR